ncbi:hypothetical protein R1sor_005306 [Riccia sorocarpa]|uniref:Phagocyte signaling-impaired protein n=1 Tax=Riccia sorocarpa TaxID=122646 RepID=A0ABD3HNJ2_9MARC
MSSAKAAIAERRLRPLRDAIDTRNYKQALKLATALLAKHPDSAYVLALKALVLERTGKPDEAVALCTQAKDTKPVDDLTLSTLQLVYSKLKLPNQATLCYEYACSVMPNNLEVLMALFKCYVREYLYVKQQQTAMKLYRLVGEERFLLWAVCSILMQVGSSGGGGSKLVPLAEALLKKRIDSHGLHELEALMLYISILQQEEKYEAALEVITGKLGELFSIQNDKLRLQGELLMRLHRYVEAADVFQEVLKASSDDWAVFTSYLDASLGRCQQATGGELAVELEEHEVDQRLEKVLKLVSELQACIPAGELKRGLFLAHVEVAKRRLLFRKKIGTEDQIREQSAVLADTIRSFFSRFGFLLSFSSDISEYLEYVDETHRDQLSNDLHEASSQFQNESPIKQLRRKISAFQVDEQLLSKGRATNTDLVLRVTKMANLYVESLELSADLDAQESMHGEELLVLATNLLTELFRRTQNMGFLLEAILVLEFGLYTRRYSSQYKLLLIDLYILISAVAPALDWYRTLDVKYILIETISHLILPGLLASTRWADLQGLLKDGIKFYENHQTESADLTILAYNHSTYSKVLEFVEFKERLERSHQRLVFRSEAAMLSLKEHANSLEELELALAELDFGRIPLHWGAEENLLSLSYNEDLQSRPWWSPAPEECLLVGPLREAGAERNWHYVENDEERKKRENCWRSSVKRRCLTPRILSLLLNSVKETNGALPSGSDVADELEKLTGSYLLTLGLSTDTFEAWLQETTSSDNLFETSAAKPVDLMTSSLFWTMYRLSSKDSKSASTVTLFVKTMGCVLEEVLKVVLRDLIEGQPELKVLAPGTGLPTVSGLISECFAWLSVYLQAWHKQMQPTSGKKKKKGSSSVEQNSVSVDTHLSTSLESIRAEAVLHLEKLQSVLNEALLTNSDQLQDVSNATLTSNMAGSPGAVIKVLESSRCLEIATKLAARTTQTQHRWQADDLLRNMILSQHEALDGVKSLCTLRLNNLKSLKF